MVHLSTRMVSMEVARVSVESDGKISQKML